MNFGTDRIRVFFYRVYWYIRVPPRREAPDKHSRGNAVIIPKNHQKSGDRRARQNKFSGSRGGANHPPQLNANVELKHQYRYISTSGASTTITDSLLLTAAGVNANTAILGSPIMRCVKVNRIEIWAPPASQGAAVTCSILYPASAANPMPREVSDTSVSVSSPAHVVSTPPPNSLPSFWQAGTGANLFTLVAPPGSIIDVWLSMVINDNSAVPTTAVLVGASVGATYYCSLDSATKAGSIYQAVSLSSV
jgi:hypothetical protein